jgi:3-oxoacyl-[acyl-carrier protein] reductase
MAKLKVLLTGGNGDIGSMIAEELAKYDLDIISPSRNTLNISEPSSIDNFMQDANFDIIINNAGINNPKIVLECNDLNDVMQTNFYGPYHIIKKTLPYMIKKQYGNIINMGSIFIDFTKNGRSAYSISKNALHALTKSIAVEYGSYGILCNTVSPGFVDTKLTHKNNTPETINKILSEVPLQRLATTKEIAKLVVYLCTQNSFITGQNIVIDGGFSCLG